MSERSERVGRRERSEPQQSLRRTHPATADPLGALADAYGVVREYKGDEGQALRGSDEAVAAALRALGAPLDDVGDAPAALAELRAGEAARLAEPVAVAWDGEPAPLALRPDAGRVRLTLRREDGSEERWSADAAAARLPRGLPPGYHDLHVEAAGAEAEVLVVAAPTLAPAVERPLWGVFLPLYSLPAAGPLADFGDLAALVRATAARGASLVGTTPLYAAFLDDPFEPSPYSPASRLFWNELYVDFQALPELDASPTARSALESVARAGGNEGLIDYRAVAAARRPVLDALAEAAFAGRGARREALEARLADDPRLEQYARFRAAREADPEAAWRRHVYAQLVAEEQLADLDRSADAAGSGLYLDLPVGVHPEAFDVAAEPASFATGISVGAPPDLFQPDGQDWGLPPLHPVGIRETRHRYTIAMLRHAFRHARALRIDHVAGLHRLFWVPTGLSAKDGVYVRYPAQELYAITLVEASRRGAVVAGEDLGTVPREVRQALARHGILRSWVLEFELDPADAGPAPAPTADALASIGTHDLPQFAAWWRDGKAAEQAPSEARRRLAELARGPAPVVLANLEDLWGETEPQNRPGTTGGANWRRRARYGVDDLQRVPDAAAGLAALQEARP